MEYLWLAFGLISAVFLGFRDVVSKKLLNTGKIRPIKLVFDEYLFLGLIIGVFLFNNIRLGHFSEFWYLYVLKGMCAFTFTVLYFSMMRKYELSSVAPIMNLSPIFLIVLSSIFLAERVTLLQMIGIMIVIVATYFLEFHFHLHMHRRPHSIHWKDVKNKFKLKKIDFFILTLLILTAVSACAIFDKMILDTGSNISTDLFFTALFIAFLISIYLKKEKILHQTIVELVQNPLRILAAAFTSISSFFVLAAFAVPGALISLVIPVRRTSTLFASLFGGVLFHEKHLKKKVIAVSIMLIGIFVMAFS